MQNKELEEAIDLELDYVEPLDEGSVLVSPEEQLYLQIMEDLNTPRGDGLKAGLKTRLHQDQIDVLAPLYNSDIKSHFFANGRKWGKTELMGYVLWRHALLNPGSACYYVGPEAAHARKIVWDLNRFQRFMGKDTKKYIETIRNQEMMIKLKNGSFIQVVGSDNYTVANGLTPSFAVYDEFKAFNHRWHTEFAPNRAAKAAPLIIIGTKPRAGNKNMVQYNQILDYAKKHPEQYNVAERTTWDNPINHLPAQKKMIEEEIAQLMESGEEDVVQLEYYSKYVPGGKAAIFPMLSKEKHMMDHHEMVEIIMKDYRRYDWILATDPGTTTCWAALIIAIHPYTKKVYIVDEIYETDQNNTSVRCMYPKMKELMEKYAPGMSIDDDWLKVADEAAAWAMTEIMAQYGTYFIPTQKAHNKKDMGLSLIKDQLIHSFMSISSNCEKLWKEMEQYARDHNGNIPKIHDHAIDTLRYANAACNYSMIEAIRSKELHDDGDIIRSGRSRRFEDDSFNDSDDWMDKVFTW